MFIKETAGSEAVEQIKEYKKVRVSVLISTYNCAKYLPEAIDSALNQTYQNFEIILIDDGSTDHTRAIVEEYQKRYPEKIRYIYQENQGLAIARNTGIKAAQSDYLALLDADDIWCPERLKKGMETIESNPGIGLVHANITRIDENGMTLSTPIRDLKYLTGPMFENIFLRKADISCPTVLFRKACCDDVGLFDPHLARLGCEDRELWLRIARKFKIVYIDQIFALYRMRLNSMSNNQQKMLKARLYVVDKFSPSEENDRLRCLALAKIYRDLGDEHLFRQQFEHAKEQYWKSISFNPFSFWTWINLGKSFIKLKVRHVS